MVVSVGDVVEVLEASVAAVASVGVVLVVVSVVLTTGTGSGTGGGGGVYDAKAADLSKGWVMGRAVLAGTKASSVPTLVAISRLVVVALTLILWAVGR